MFLVLGSFAASTSGEACLRQERGNDCNFIVAVCLSIDTQIIKDLPDYAKPGGPLALLTAWVETPGIGRGSGKSIQSVRPGYSPILPSNWRRK